MPHLAKKSRNYESIRSLRALGAVTGDPLGSPDESRLASSDCLLGLIKWRLTRMNSGTLRYLLDCFMFDFSLHDTGTVSYFAVNQLSFIEESISDIRPLFAPVSNAVDPVTVAMGTSS